MGQVKFSKNGVFIPQRVNYKLKRDEEKEEMIDKYINNECNFQIEYDNEGEPKVKKKE